MVRTLAIALALIALGGLVLALSPARAEDAPPAPADGTVTFYDDQAKPFTTSLTVRSPSAGTTELLNGPPGEEEDGTNGNHTFPPHTTAKAVAEYYRTILKRAGYKDVKDDPEGKGDFQVVDGSIHFWGVNKLDGGVRDGKGFKMFGVVNSKAFKYEEFKKVKEIWKYSLCLLRTPGGSSMAGVMEVVAYGVRYNDDETITACVSEITTYFSATDTASAIMSRMRDQMIEAGWDVKLDGETLRLRSNAQGATILSVSYLPEYFEEVEDEETEDHWIFFDSGDD